MESAFAKYQLVKKKAPNSELAATVEEVLKVVGKTKQYDFPYWCAIVKKAKVSYVEMLGILKKIESAPDKYPKGGILVNKLKKRWTDSSLNK